MAKAKEKELNIAKDRVSIQLRASIPGTTGYRQDHWPLATVSGGIEAITIRREGDDTIIRIKSPEALIHCDDVERPPQKLRKAPTKAQASG